MKFTDGQSHFINIQVHDGYNPFYELELYDTSKMPCIELSSGEEVYVVSNLDDVVNIASAFVSSDTSVDDNGIPKRRMEVTGLWVGVGQEW